jgi:RimJ/RimL family protein N-acetyltransferase
MTTAWLQSPIHPAAQIADAVARLVPVIRTARLVLRAPLMADAAPYLDLFTTDRTKYIGGPFSLQDAYNDFCQGVAGWMLRGAGMWALTDRDGGAPLGWIYLWQEFCDPEPELGWVLTQAAEGHGFAAEAARAVLPHAVALYGANGFVSYIDNRNDRSARLAVSLGAQRDTTAEAQMTALGQPDLHVYRHSGQGAPL